MKTTNNTILITGGSAGIGFETARIFSAAGNKVIITGRDKQRLDRALTQLPGVTGILGDISSKDDTDNLVATLKNDFPDLNIVINNAGKAYLYDIGNSEDAYGKAEDEMLTNYLSVIRLNEKLLPHLKTKQDAAIVNVSSVVAFVPGSLATYSASKAALHSYTQSLRVSLERNSSVKVFELMPPLVNTELSQAIGGANGIPPAEVAKGLFGAFESDTYEVRVGNTQYIYDLFRQSPGEALNVMQPAK